MTRVALYARYSSDNQREASIQDQFRVCRDHAEREGWRIVAPLPTPAPLATREVDVSALA